MSDQATQAAQDTTAPTISAAASPATTPPAQPPAPVPPAAQPPAAPPAGTGGQEPDWLPERLERAKVAGLKAAGFGSVEEAQEAKELLAAQEEAQKTAEEKAVEAKTVAEKATARTAELEATITKRCDAEMLRLTEEQRAAVIGIAGDDPNVRLRTIDALAPTWVAAPAPTTPTAPADGAAAPPAAPPAAPASTMPATGGPPPSPPAGEENHLAVYTDLNASNPMQAAKYYLMHRESIVRAQQANG